VRISALALLALGCGTQTGTIGAVIARSPEGELTIHEVPRQLGADAAGLLPGDQILLIDGRDVRSLDPKQVHALLVGEVGDPVKLTIVRGEKVLRVTVKRTAARKWSSRQPASK
jgi:C-terminal processing protease CtpA/Prc